MSFIPESQLGAEAERAREQELEARAERYAETHPDDGGSDGSPNLLRRIINLVRRPDR
jgi:hypothetical protein